MNYVHEQKIRVRLFERPGVKGDKNDCGPAGDLQLGLLGTIQVRADLTECSTCIPQVRN